MKDMPEEDCRKLLINFQEEKETYEIKAKVIPCFSSSIVHFLLNVGIFCILLLSIVLISLKFMHRKPNRVYCGA